MLFGVYTASPHCRLMATLVVGSTVLPQILALMLCACLAGAVSTRRPPEKSRKKVSETGHSMTCCARRRVEGSGECYRSSNQHKHNFSSCAPLACPTKKLPTPSK